MSNGITEKSTQEIHGTGNMRIRKAVGAIITNSSGKALLVHKAKISDSKDEKVKSDSWDFIKGGVKPNESMPDALKRELYEETGIEQYVIKKEFEDKLCFEFPQDLRDVIGYDKQETTMYLVQMNDSQSGFRCIDDEIDDYELVDKNQVLGKLSQKETREFWTNIYENGEKYGWNGASGV